MKLAAKSEEESATAGTQTMNHAAETPLPGPITDRIAALDIVRGLALFGVLQVNLFSFSGQAYLGEAYPTGPASEWLGLLRDLLINGKAMSCFSMLFGVGLAIQMERALARGASFRSFALRRLGALALIGAGHATLIWNGDILLDYALIGLALVPFLKARTRTILLAALGAFLLDITFRQIMAALHAPPTFFYGYWRSQFGWIYPAAAQAYGHGTWLEAARFRVWEWLHPGRAIHLISVFGCMPQFFIGLALWRSGILRDLVGSRRTIRGLFHASFWPGLVLTLPSVLLLARMAAWRSGWREMARVASYEGPMILLALGYFTGLLLLLGRERGSALLAKVAPMGRMALSHYLAQSLVCTWAFSGHGLGLWGKIPPAGVILGGMGLYGIQLAASAWWLQRFRFGPAEWLWRSMTYGAWQPFRLAQVGSEAVSVEG